MKIIEIAEMKTTMIIDKRERAVVAMIRAKTTEGVQILAETTMMMTIAEIERITTMKYPRIEGVHPIVEDEMMMMMMTMMVMITRGGDLHPNVINLQMVVDSLTKMTQPEGELEV